MGGVQQACSIVKRLKKKARERNLRGTSYLVSCFFLFIFFQPRRSLFVVPTAKRNESGCVPAVTSLFDSEETETSFNFVLLIIFIA